MITLNLVEINKSDINYKISKFPDGQQQIKIECDDESQELPKPIDNEAVLIKSRLNNFLDLELICCSVASLKELYFKNIELYVPYFLGSRSDRKFEEGSNNYLKTVICPIINSLGFSKVTTIDPHSDVIEACLNNFNKISNEELVKNTLSKLVPIKASYDNYRKDRLPKEAFDLSNITLISPDAGANKKIFKLAEDIGFDGEIITCSKYRDKDGKLSRTSVPLNLSSRTKDLYIIDDLIDGGYTFINIAKIIREKVEFSKTKIYLIITHGIFSKGFDELNKYFDGIYCTNSYSDIPDYYDNGMEKFKTNVKQYNVF